MTDLGIDLRGLSDLEQEFLDREARWAVDAGYVVGTAVEYAVYVNYGTRDQDPQPFFTSTLAEARNDLRRFVAIHTGTRLEEITSAQELVQTIAFALERVMKQRAPVDTGTLRASIQAVPLANIGDLPSADDVDPAATTDIEVSA
jgi:hypothetical protein